MLFQPTESSSNEVLTIFAIILGIIHLISHWKRWKDVTSEHYRKESGYIVVNKAIVLTLYFLVCVILGHCLGSKELLNIEACGTLITLEAFCITALFHWQLNGAILLQSTIRLFIIPAVKLTHFMIVGYGVPCLLSFIVIVSFVGDKDFLFCESSSVYQNATTPTSMRKCALSQCTITSNLQGTILKTLVILLPMLISLIATAVQFAKVVVAMWTTWNRIAKSNEARVKDFAHRLGLLRLLMNFHVMLMISLSTVAIFYAPEEYSGIAHTVFSACITGAVRFITSILVSGGASFSSFKGLESSGGGGFGAIFQAKGIPY